MNKKGISIVSLSIVIIILLILLSTISISITYSVENAKKRTFAEEIYNIQSLVSEYIENEESLPVTTETIKIKPSDVSQFSVETIVDGEIMLEVLDLRELGIKNTKYGNKEIGDTEEEKSKDIYAVSPSTGKVYYIAGFKSSDKIYYTLTEDLLGMIDRKQDLVISESTITFLPSRIGWSNEGISLRVTVPVEYTSPSISINNANITYTTETVDGITYYNVNTAKVAEAYTVTVSYTKDGTNGTAIYSAKLDTVIPVISKDTNVSNTETHVKGISAIDDKSGIKYFKYVKDYIEPSDARTYIRAYGKNIKGDSIKFSKEKVYTLYAEDKAGNYYVMYIDEYGNLVSKVEKRLVNIKVTKEPTKTSYNVGEAFDKTGMVVTATYNIGSKAKITDYTITNGSSLKLGQTSITISYTDNGITKTTTQPIKVTKVLSSIKVTTAPTKTSYNTGEAFNKTGMVVTATYNDGSTAKVTDYTVTNGSSLTTGQTSVTISYTENGVTKTTTQAITVSKVLSSIKVTTAPTKTSYNTGEYFDETGMVVTATYNDKTTTKVTGYTVTNGNSLTTGQTSVTISYTENGVTKTTTQPITVIKPNPATLAASNTWYTSSTAKSSITIINIVKNASRTTVENASESWPAAVDADGDGSLNDDIMCYINGTTLTIAGNGADKIMANSTSNNLFYNFSAVTNINGLALLDTTNVTNMMNMFLFCSSLTTLDVSNFDTSNVTKMYGMFNGCTGLTTLDVSNFDTTNVTEMNSMFSSCSSLTTLDVSNFNTSNVTDMHGMFIGCKGLTEIDVSNFDTSNVTKMSSMFSGCKGLTELDVSNFDTTNVSTMNSMFNSCSGLTEIDLSNFNTSNTTKMGHMFYKCSSLTSPDISTFDTSNVTEMSSMFEGCTGLTTLDVSNFNTNALVDYVYLKRFAYNCTNLSTIILGSNFGQSYNVPSSFSISRPAASVGLSYHTRNSADNFVTTVVGANEVMQNYDWAADYRTVTFIDTLP